MFTVLAWNKVLGGYGYGICRGYGKNVFGFAVVMDMGMVDILVFFSEVDLSLNN